MNTSKFNILMESKDLKELKWPSRMRSSPNNRDKSKYCDFHHDHGHTTKTYKVFQRKIESLIKTGFLGDYVSQDNCSRNDHNKENTSKVGDSNQLIKDIINFIV